MSETPRLPRPNPDRKVRASILDRLLDDNPDGPPEKPPFRTQSRGRFANSLIRDLGLLLNTRTTKRFDVGEEAGTRTVLDYGVDDYAHLSPASEADRMLIERQIKSAIKYFEPRLQVTRIRVVPVEGKHRQCELRVWALLWADTVREPVSFRVALNMQEGTTTVHGS